MGVDDRVGLATHGVSQEDKLSRTFSVPAHASVQSVSQVWRAGPLRVWLEERDGRVWVAVNVRSDGLRELLRSLGWSACTVRAAVGAWGWSGVGVWKYEFDLTPALDRFLVELVDVIADVRRAAGTVQLELEHLVEQGD